MTVPFFFAQQGWVCPVCGRGNAPWASTCLLCIPGGPKYTVSCPHTHTYSDTTGTQCSDCGEMWGGLTNPQTTEGGTRA